MKAYRVEGGIARIGMSEKVGLTEEQFRARRHRVTLFDGKGNPVRLEATVEFKDGEIKEVLANEPLEFKNGEEVHLGGELPRHLAERLVPAGSRGDRKPQPERRAKTGAEKKAAAARKSASRSAATGSGGKVATAARSASETGHAQGVGGTGGTTGTQTG